MSRSASDHRARHNLGNKMFLIVDIHIVERFDRRIASVKQGPGIAERKVLRRHVVDACQLLDRARGFKHTGATLQALQEIVERATNKIATRLQLFRWLVFNIAVANDDCHLKNLSFFMSADGVQLAPHYDLLATSVWNTRTFADEKANWPKGKMAFALPGAERFSEVTAKSVLEAGQALGVPYDAGARIVRQVVERLPASLEKVAAELAQRHRTASEAARRFTGAEARLVRVLQHIVVPDMLRRLAPSDAQLR